MNIAFKVSYLLFKSVSPIYQALKWRILISKSLFSPFFETTYAFVFETVCERQPSPRAVSPVTVVGLRATKLSLLLGELSGAGGPERAGVKSSPWPARPSRRVANCLRSWPCIALLPIIKVESFQFCHYHSPHEVLVFCIVLFVISCWHCRAWSARQCISLTPAT